MNLPALNLLSPAALTGLCYRALAGEASGADAPLTRRRLENLATDRTELALRVSALKADVEVARQKARAARETAGQAELDQRIFNEEHPAQEPVKGLFGKRRPGGNRETENQRQEQIELAQLARQEAQAIEATAKQLEQDLAKAEQRCAELESQRAGLHDALRGQLAALVLEALARGDEQQAAVLLAAHRHLIRGDLMIGTLRVLTRLFTHGPEGARQELLECRPIFEQHSTGAPRILESLIKLVQGAHLSHQHLGLMLKEQFQLPGMFNLYQLTLALDGRGLDQKALEANPFFATLWMVREYSGGLDPAAEFETFPAEELAQWAIGGDLILRTIVAHILLVRGAEELAFRAAGIPAQAFEPPKRGQSAPDLMPLISAIHISGWPPALVEAWRAALACHVLASARDQVPAPLFDCWVEESYGWPKSDLYWWTLGKVKGDSALWSNIVGAKDDLFCVAGI